MYGDILTTAKAKSSLILPGRMSLRSSAFSIKYFRDKTEKAGVDVGDKQQEFAPTYTP